MDNPLSVHVRIDRAHDAVILARLEEPLARPACSHSSGCFTVSGASFDNISAGDRSSNSTENINTDAAKKLLMNWV